MKKRTDKQRLNWFVKGKIFLVRVNAGWITSYCHESETEKHFQTPREAIDAAMDEEENGK